MYFMDYFYMTLQYIKIENGKRNKRADLYNKEWVDGAEMLSVSQMKKRLRESFLDPGSLIPDEWLNQQGYRMVICEKHMIIYRQIDKAVYIYHIVDTQTEYTKLF